MERHAEDEEESGKNLEADGGSANSVELKNMDEAADPGKNFDDEDDAGGCSSADCAGVCAGDESTVGRLNGRPRDLWPPEDLVAREGGGPAKGVTSDASKLRSPWRIPVLAGSTPNAFVRAPPKE
jgi:hypothetical protein